jgi:hypothetical protein
MRRADPLSPKPTSFAKATAGKRWRRSFAAFHVVPLCFHCGQARRRFTENNAISLNGFSKAWRVGCDLFVTVFDRWPEWKDRDSVMLYGCQELGLDLPE